MKKVLIFVALLLPFFGKSQTKTFYYDSVGNQYDYDFSKYPIIPDTASKAKQTSLTRKKYNSKTVPYRKTKRLVIKPI